MATSDGVVMSAFLDPTTADELPDPAAPLVLSRVIVEAWLMTVSRKEAEAFLKNLGAVIASREEMMHVVPIRRTPQAEAAAKAEREALAALRQNLSIWLARVPSE